MRKIGAGPFLWYSLVGLVLMALGWQVVLKVHGSSMGRQLSPDFKAYLDYQYKMQAEKAHHSFLLGERKRWMHEHSGLLLQRKVEQALAGAIPVTELPSNLVQVVQTIRHHGMNGEALPYASNAISRLWWWFSLGGEKKRPDVPYLKCERWDLLPLRDLRNGVWVTTRRVYYPNGCAFTGPLKVLNEPTRLMALLAGDLSKITVWSPPPMPPDPGLLTIEYPRDRPATTMRMPINIPSYPWHVWWVLLSCFFAIGYTLIGLTVHDSYNWPHPMSRPNFIFGWLVVAAAAPGFALIGLVHLLFRPLKLTTISAAMLEDQFNDVATSIDGLIVRAERLNAADVLTTLTAMRGRIVEARTAPDRLALLEDTAQQLAILDELEALERRDAPATE